MKSKPRTLRWGSDEAFEAEMGARKARAEASYEARKRAYLSQDRPHTSPTSTAAPEGKPGASEGSEGAGDGYNWPPFARRKPYPARSRLLHLSRETNYVGVNQQQYHSVRGEKYGFFTVVNEAFFDSGPTVCVSDIRRTVRRERRVEAGVGGPGGGREPACGMFRRGGVLSRCAQKCFMPTGQAKVMEVV